MQSIAEEVVSSSGGGAKYITSGFSAYNGHPAIGLGWTSIWDSVTMDSSAAGVGIISGNTIEGAVLWDRTSGISSVMSVDEGTLQLTPASSVHTYFVAAIVF